MSSHSNAEKIGTAIDGLRLKNGSNGSAGTLFYRSIVSSHPITLLFFIKIGFLQHEKKFTEAVTKRPSSDYTYSFIL